MKRSRILLYIVKNDVFSHPLLIGIRHCIYESVLDLKLEKPYHIGSNVTLRTFPVGHLPNTTFSSKPGLHLGNDIFIDLIGSISIGRNVTISFGTKILRHKHHILKSHLSNSKMSVNDLVVGDEVFIGCNSCILPKVERIGYGAIIGAGSVVTKNVKPFDIVAGNPARKIGKREISVS
ncbi:MAG: acyltransferase [Candidatus Hodarchaeota archaeon]